MVNNKKEGIGIIYYRNGNIYMGDLKNDDLNGAGVYIFAKGDRY